MQIQRAFKKSVRVDFNRQKVKLPKLNYPMRFKYMVNITSWYRTAVGKYFASCLFAGEQDYTGITAEPEKVIGLDMCFSHNLVRDYEVIVVEDLLLKGIYRALSLRKSVMDMGYSGFVKRRYKALWNDKTVLVADKRFRSSKMYHVCGYIKQDALLQERWRACPQCGTNHNRDTNVAINLPTSGLSTPAPCL